MYCKNCPTTHLAVVCSPRSCQGLCGKLIPSYNKNCRDCSNRDAQCEQCAHQETPAEKSARQHFVDGLLARHEADVRDASGKLPLKVTHEIIGYDSDGKAYVVRVRMH